MWSKISYEACDTGVVHILSTHTLLMSTWSYGPIYWYERLGKVVSEWTTMGSTPTKREKKLE